VAFGKLGGEPTRLRREYITRIKWIYQGERPMEIHELAIEMKLLERRMTLYEEK
jgi:hypothetical protein